MYKKSVRLKIICKKRKTEYTNWTGNQFCSRTEKRK